MFSNFHSLNNIIQLDSLNEHNYKILYAKPVISTLALLFQVFLNIGNGLIGRNYLLLRLRYSINCISVYFVRIDVLFLLLTARNLS